MRPRSVLLAALLGLVLVASAGGAAYLLAQRAADEAGFVEAPAVRDCALQADLTVTPQPAAAPRPQGDPPSPQWERAFDELASQVEEIRGLKFNEPVRRSVMSKEQMADYVRSDVADPSDADALERAGHVLKFLGLIPADGDLAKIVGEAYGEEVVGFYDEETNDLVVRTDLGGPNSITTRLVIVHELVHALDDQHFDLDAMQKRVDGTGRSDEATALVAFIEGVAMVASGQFVERYLGVKLPDDLVESRESAAAGALDQNIPPYVRKQMIFPYTSGARFVSAIRDSGGWEAVNDAYRNLPGSTAEIMRPSLYRESRSNQTAVTVGAVTEVIEAELGERWYQVDEGVMGEYDLTLLMDSAEITNVAVAAEGWRGDWYRFVGCDERRLLAAKFDTASESDAAELAGALDVWASRWAGAGGPTRSWVVNRSGESVTMLLAGQPELASRVGGKL